MLDLSTAASFQEGDILFSDSQSDAKLILGQSALSAALCKAVSQSDWGDRDPKTKDATLNLRRYLHLHHVLCMVMPAIWQSICRICRLHARDFSHKICVLDGRIYPESLRLLVFRV